MKYWDSCTKRERIERWEQCLRVLKNLSPHERRKHWDMRNWGRKTDCGTVACAAGHCGLDPWFRRRGFCLIPEEMDDSRNASGYFKDEAGPIYFFGPDGTQEIFWNSDPRPVSQVIREVKAYIKELKADA